MASEDWPFTNAWSLHGNKEIVARYEILERIGEGTFGEVHRARRREDNLIVALKEIHDFDSSDREVKALLLLDHPNVVKLHEYFAQGSNMVLVLEYLPHNLSEVIRAGKGEISDGEVKGWMIQILQGLAACHAASVLHRDLKPNNLLISADRTLKIADFGQARILSEVDFENEEGLSGSEIHNNYGTGSEGRSVHYAPTISGSQEGEFQADVSVAEGQRSGETCTKVGGVPSRSSKFEASVDYSGVGLGQSMGKGSFSNAALESTPLARDFDSVLRESDNLEGSNTHLGSGPTNVGFSALADAVKDARNYFTVEEMVRTGTGIHGLGLPGLQRQQIVSSQPTEDPGCCGWFPMENAENHPALTGVRNLSSGNETTGKVNVVSVGSDQTTELEDEFTSDESDADWKGKYGMRTEDVIDALKKTEESRKAGVSSSSAKGDGDFLQKLRRFIRKRTRRLNNEGSIAGPLHPRNERISTGRGNSVKEAPQRDGHGPHMPRSLGPRKNASIERHSANVKGVPLALHSLKSATANIPSSRGDRVSSQAQIRKGSRNHHGKEKTSPQLGNDLGQGPVVADGRLLDSMDEVSVVSGIDNEHCAKQRLDKEGDGSTLPEKSEEDFMDGEEDWGDLRTESGRKLYGGLKVEKVEKEIRNKVVVNGPLREMAYAKVHEGGETAAIGQLEFKDNFRADGRDCSEVETGGAETSSNNTKKSSGDEVNDFPWSHQKALKSPNVPAEEALGTKNCEIPSTWGVGGNDGDSIAEALGGRWEGASGEPIPNKDVCKSWTQTEEYNSTLSDAEGTRWYGAPEFQYSYMDAKIAASAGGKVPDETYGRATGSEEEWEREGLEVGTYQNSQESTGGRNSESEHGSDFTTMVGTRWYKAPELLYGATKYGMGIDIWAVGCIFGELLWGKPLFPGLNDIDQLSRLVRILGSPNEEIWAGVSLLPDFNKICFVDDRSPLTLRKYLRNISEAALDFLQKLLTYDPALRLTAEIALEDGFFLKPPLPCPCHELQLPTGDESEASDEEWGDWKDPGSPFSDFEILG
ncbi:unnamed protein product [Calypogeia fissa]